MRNIIRRTVCAVAALAMIPVGANLGTGASGAGTPFYIVTVVPNAIGIDVLVRNNANFRGVYCLLMAREPGTGPFWFHHALFNIESHDIARPTIIGIDKSKHWELKAACDGNALESPVFAWN